MKASDVARVDYAIESVTDTTMMVPEKKPSEDGTPRVKMLNDACLNLRERVREKAAEGWELVQVVPDADIAAPVRMETKTLGVDGKPSHAQGMMLTLVRTLVFQRWVTRSEGKKEEPVEEETATA